MKEHDKTEALPPGIEGDWQTLAEFVLPSEPGNDRVAMEKVAAAVAPLEMPRDQLERLKTAVAEATLNALEHGNRYQPDLTVCIWVRTSRRGLAVQITDQGSCPIDEPETPDLDAKLEGRQSPRGWGFFLIKRMVDDMKVYGGPSHHTIELFLYAEGASRS